MKIPDSFFNIFAMLAFVVLIFFSFQLPLYISLPAGLILILIPLVRLFKRKAGLDERQKYISHLSGNIAFYIYMVLLLLVLSVLYLSKNENPPNYFYVLLIVPLVARLLIILFLNYPPIVASKWIVIFFAAAWFLFAVLSHGLSLVSLIEALPSAIVIVFALFSHKFKLVAGIVYTGIGAFFAFFVLKENFPLFQKILMFSILPAPVLVSGIFILFNVVRMHNAEINNHDSVRT